MKLNLDSLHRSTLANAGIRVPVFDVEKMRRQAHDHPHWMHIGPGNLFRVHIARLAQDIMESGTEQCGIAAVAPRNPQRLDCGLGEHDLLTLGVTSYTDGHTDFGVIASVSEGLAYRRADDFDRICEIACADALQMITLTITEKGYQLNRYDGSFQDAVTEDLGRDPMTDPMSTTMALVAGLLVRRFYAGATPVAVVSCDNFSHNGDKLRTSVLTIAAEWQKRGIIEPEAVTWLSEKVAFPISVIDKITPVPSQSVAERLASMGFEDMAIDAHAGVAGFVNTEPAEYLVIEDCFPNGRPKLEKAGVHFTNRDVCDRFERMKVTTCLNPLHTALAITGVLLRKPTIDDAMKDPSLAGLVHYLGWKEGLPVVSNPGIVDPQEFLREVEEERFPNPFLGDTPSRIATDTSQKIPIRFGETVKSYLNDSTLDIKSLRAIPFVFAAWCRYLMGIADDGKPIDLSPDPLLKDLRSIMDGVHLGNNDPKIIFPILSRADIFGVDLTLTPLADIVGEYFTRLTAAPGAVRSVLDKEFNQS
ncbi:mannitol dehydrogenase family protein [Cutibacterium sp. WCA-380-WT-3A]|uniref:Mannitol dehydrogenase family protein n=1 Tax=Cutibacterium porci TaxID=2605781 RepID=A0A7K0J403_9ACTN|nr:mannitol dehydrogenase family protein [Cutibacterium porci]MSS44657.1 mannitol dehydrogenase family protein [Cutibacterium porci]